MMALPNPTEDVCFHPSVFQSEDFSVDEFVSDCKRRVTTEHLHDDLQAYYSTLKAAMVELINKDYADFLDLSANLVGMDKQIEEIALPLSQLQQEIMVIKHSMEVVVGGLEDKMSAREEIRSKKVLLKKLIEVVDSTELLERLLVRQGEEKLEEGELDRVAMEFNKLRYNTSVVADLPLVKELTPRIEAITSQFQTILQKMLGIALETRDHTLLLHTLETYSLICNVEAAEGFFRQTVVAPGMKEIISTKAVLTDQQGLDGVYAGVLRFIPKNCGFIFEVSNGVPGFDLLINAVWPEIVSAIETRAAVIFAPGNPDLFYKNFSSTMKFLDQFESNCKTMEQVKKLRGHPSYNAFISKWSLPVYFQIRFQEIGGALEAQLELPLSEAGSDEDQLFSLRVFSVLSSSLSHCWCDGVFLPVLTHRFWKLTLQLMIRVRSWLSEILDDPQVLSIDDCIRLVHDIQVLESEFPKLFLKKIQDKLSCLLGEEKTQGHRGIFEQTCMSLSGLVPRITSYATGILAQQSVRNLDPVNTIPRLYRRTNREVPKKPSGYVSNILKPLAQINHRLLQTDQSRKWREMVIDTVTEKYQEMTSEVLNNVKRTEDSLLKLKRTRRSLQVETVTGMSDDNKIRLQLAIDIEAYTKEVANILPLDFTSSSFQKLLDMASVAKTTAFFSTPKEN